MDEKQIKMTRAAAATIEREVMDIFIINECFSQLTIGDAKGISEIIRTRAFNAIEEAITEHAS